MVGDSIINLILGALAGSGSLAAYTKYRRPTLMSSESRAEFKEMYAKKQDVTVCDRETQHMAQALTRLEEGQGVIQKDIKSILKGVNGRGKL